MIIIIIIVALILRVINLDQSLWLDEAINVNNATNLDYKTLTLNYSLGDFHPPLFHVVLKTWILLFGNSEIAVRSPSIIFAIFSILLVYLIAKKLYDKKTALIAATLLATAPLHIYYSQEARMYMLAAFLVSLSVYFFISLIKSDKIIYWIGFIASTSLMLYSDYLPYLMIPTYLLFIFLNRKKIAKSTLVSFIPASLVILILLIPWLTLFPEQLKTGLSASSASPAWTQVVGAASFKNFFLTFAKFTIGRISLDNNLTYALLFAPVAMYVVLLFLLSLFRMSKNRSFIFLWFFTPIVLGFAISFLIPVYAYFRFIFVLPAFYLIWASAINTVNWALPIRILLTLALIVNISSSIIYFVNPRFHREHWREATTYVKKESTNKTLILFESSLPFAPFDYYNRESLDAKGAFKSFSATQKEVDLTLENLVQNNDKIFLFQYLSGITDPQGLVFKKLTNLGYENISTKDFPGVGFVYEFTY